MTEQNLIACAYDAGVDDEYGRLAQSPLREFEFGLISGSIEALVPPCSTIIDIGAGPGRYAERFLSAGHRVGVVDLSARSLKAFRDRTASSLSGLLFNRVCCATKIGWIKDAIADAVLLMGPMYHLTRYGDRTEALRHCRRILRPGGYLFSVFLCAFPQLTENNSGNAPQDPSQDEAITWTDYKGYRVPQFRCTPMNAERFFLQTGFSLLSIRIIKTAHGSSDQFFCIARKTV
jgi:SAM-dependent methyltransferase